MTSANGARPLRVFALTVEATMVALVAYALEAHPFMSDSAWGPSSPFALLPFSRLGCGVGGKGELDDKAGAA